MADQLLTSAVACHAWNKGRSMVALSPNTHEVFIYDTKKSEDFSKWEKKYTLTEHSQFVSCIDWHPETNQIVTCGHDRNAYVWTFEGNEWKPGLVVLRINRAATSVKWSPLGNKFAVASGAKCVPICHYEPSNKWWISKMIKKHKSTVLSVDWCINNKFIITGSSDMKARIFSAYLEGIDSPEDDGFGEVFPNQHEFGEILQEFDQAGAWVHAVAWSPGAFRLAFAGHGSTIHFIQLLGGSSPLVQTIKTPNLPFLDIKFLSDNTVVAAGFDMNPAIFTVSGGSDAQPVWAFKEWADKKDKSAGSAAKASAFGAARAQFSATVNQGASFGAKAEESSILTKHKNIISNICAFFDPSGNPTFKFTTAGLDGRVLFWDVKSVGI